MKKYRKRILNVGCGRETYGTHFVDLYPTRPEVKEVNIDNEKPPFPANYFNDNEVYSKNLLEHLTNPGFVLKEIVRVLKKGGKLILITDNASYWVRPNKLLVSLVDRIFRLTPFRRMSFKRIKIIGIKG